MTKLIVQIPCFNEEQTLAQTVADIPRRIEGIDRVEVLIVDDGSTDRTIETARACGVDHVIRHRANRGLARSFRSGIDACLRLGADIIVNTDGDNQYPGKDIPRLIRPILDGSADFVIGDRQTREIAHFSPFKKRLQALGSTVVRRLAGLEVPDAVSGFRAMSRDMALHINIVSPFSYTIETVIQAGKKHFAVASVPIQTNADTRPSRLFKSLPRFIERSVTTMLRTYVMYQPLRVFLAIGLVLLVLGGLPVLRFLIYYFAGEGEGKIQSLVLGGALIVLGGVTLLFGMIADLINFNRQLVETTLEKVRRIELAVGPAEPVGAAAPILPEKPPAERAPAPVAAGAGEVRVVPVAAAGPLRRAMRDPA